MNEKIQKIKTIENQLKQLAVIKEDGEWAGAGLMVDMRVGLDGDQVLGLEFGVLTGLDRELFSLLEKSLTIRKEYYLKELVKENKEISEFLASKE